MKERAPLCGQVRKKWIYPIIVARVNLKEWFPLPQLPYSVRHSLGPALLSTERCSPPSASTSLATRGSGLRTWSKCIWTPVCSRSGASHPPTEGRQQYEEDKHQHSRRWSEAVKRNGSTTIIVVFCATAVVKLERDITKRTGIDLREIYRNSRILVTISRYHFFVSESTFSTTAHLSFRSTSP